MEDVYNLFLNQLSQITELSDDAKSDLQKLFSIIEVKSNDYLINEGDRVFDCYFMIDGVIRVFYSKDGNEYNKNFFIQGMFPTPITALLSNQPSHLGYQALTESILIKFSYKQFRSLFEKHKCVERLMLRILEMEWIKKEQHDINMVTNNATENYLILRETFPKLELLIPQYHIASYLGITPIQLSRIRKELSKG